MKRIGYHPHVHPALPWCVIDTNEPDLDVSRLPKLGLFATKDEALASCPEAVVDEEFAWECRIRIDRHDDR